MASLTLVMGIVFLILIILPYNKVYGGYEQQQQESCSRRCGVHYITYPFRLKDSPENCGDKRYNLSCEDNKQLILYDISYGKYYVQSINYDNFTIRLLDFNLLYSNYSLSPDYSLGLYDFSYDIFPYLDYYQYKNETDYALTKSMLFVSCPNRMEYSYIGNCMNISSYTEYGNPFYIGVYRKTISELGLGDGCRIEFMYPSSWDLQDRNNNNISCTDIRRMMLYGFELSWLNSLCKDGVGAYVICLPARWISRNFMSLPIYIGWISPNFMSLPIYIGLEDMQENARPDGPSRYASQESHSQCFRYHMLKLNPNLGDDLNQS
ncbi:unnamed protein product [Vicia faba]|uniref:Wall-associated receptor kinase galacturonan-binding domain-containing protein n=1 Tax=Vicia faba TaxID=3906 RepID=A0AAV1A4E7_VICFA|nr:unnamed protein product [Vicia faba]